MKLGKEPIKIVSTAINKLLESQQDVLVKRYGLDGSDSWTLEAIGKSYPKQITRERVRQREANSLACLRQNSLKNFQSIYDGFFVVFSKNGGAMRTDLLLSELISYFEIKKNIELNKKSFRLLLKLNDYFKEVKESDLFYNCWLTDIALVENIKIFVGELTKVVQEQKKVIESNVLFDLAKNVAININGIKKQSKEREALFSYINISKYVEKNVFGDWGLRDWSEITPKGVRDRAYLVLRKHTKPLHFGEITKLINSSDFSKKTACPQTVHNELIKDDKFILVGKGIYGLKEWGYIPGTVRNLLKQILKNLGAPMTTDKLIEEVMKQRQVKQTTVLLNLHDRKHFEKMADGRYIVK